MIVDSSVLIAILKGEPGYRRFADAMLGTHTVRISAGTLLETRIVAEHYGVAHNLDGLLDDFGIELVPTDRRQVDIAAEGFKRFGKGRHPAGLNFGDCFAYALARLMDEPLLFAGEDFARTDLEPALR